MRIALDATTSTLKLTFAGGEQRDAFVAEARERGAFMVRLDRQLRLRSSWTVALEGGGPAARLTAEVVQMFDTVTGEVATAFEVREWDAIGGGSEPEPADEPGGEAAEERDTSETLGASPTHQIRAMNPVQRSILAPKAGRTERAILLRDTSPQVLQALLSNPRLESKEVMQLVKTTHTTAAILQRVASDGRWGKNQEILTAVARNPKTPSPLAVRLMEKLRTPDLRVMAKMASGLRENVRRAALREYLRRTQKR